MLSQLLVIAASTATSLAATLTHVSQLRKEGYDFIVAGGGTAGLTVGDRLSEAFPNRVWKTPGS
jgi:choline dehydrogenase